MATMLDTPSKKKKIAKKSDKIKKSPSHLPRQETVEVTADALLSIRMSKLRPVKIRDFPFKGKTGIVYITPFSIENIDSMREKSPSGETTMDVAKMADCIAQNVFDKHGNQLMTGEQWRKVDVPTIDKITDAIYRHATASEGKA